MSQKSHTQFIYGHLVGRKPITPDITMVQTRIPVDTVRQAIRPLTTMFTAPRINPATGIDKRDMPTYSEITMNP